MRSTEGKKDKQIEKGKKNSVEKKDYASNDAVEKETIRHDFLRRESHTGSPAILFDIKKTPAGVQTWEINVRDQR